MNTTRLSFAVAVSLAVALPSARAQEPSRDAGSLTRLERALDADTYRAVVQVIEGARARALPTDPLVDRALEGAMKRAPGARIRAAVSALAQRLEIARGALAPAPTAADIAAGAGALGVGVPHETLRTIRSVQPDRPVAVPLGVLTELVTRSVPVDQAATVVVQLLRRGVTPAQLVALGADVQRDIAAGIEPGAAFDLRTRGVASTLPGSTTTALEGDATTPATPQSAGENLSSGGATRGNTRPPGRGTRRP
jgi:hypothetical protein